VFRNDLAYNPLKDFIPIIPLTRQPYVLVANRAEGVRTIVELIAAAKAKPGELKFGSTGIGTGTHVGVEKFNRATGIEAQRVAPLPGDSNADTVANAIAGRFTYYLVPISLALPHIRDSTLIALGVSTARRSNLPDVPTIAEAGVAGYDFPIGVGQWFSMLGIGKGRQAVEYSAREQQGNAARIGHEFYPTTG
jgi:tripartite-type tricarboxylate transporter receptor subunit TctC